MSSTAGFLGTAKAAATEPAVNLNNTLGALLIGLIFAATFFGVTNVQAFIYYQGTASRDSSFMRTLVGILWILDFLHLALISHLMYFYLISNFGNEGIITDPVWSFSTYVVVTALSNFVVQLVYIRRLYIMSGHNLFVTIVPAVLTIVAFGFGFSVGAISYTYTSTLQLASISWVVYVGLSASLVENMWASLALCYYIGRSKTGFRSTDAVVRTLLAYIINTGLLTSICAFCCFITFATMKSNFIYLGFYFSYAKLHFNALLAMFNARSKLLNGRTPPVSGVTSGDGGISGAISSTSYRLSRFAAASRGANAEDTKFTSIMAPASPALDGRFGLSTGGSVYSEDEEHVAARDGGGRGPKTLAVRIHTEVEYDHDHRRGPNSPAAADFRLDSKDELEMSKMNSILPL